MINKIATLLVWTALVIGLASCDDNGQTEPTRNTENSQSEAPKPDENAPPINKPLEHIQHFIASKAINKEVDGWRTRLPRFPKVEFPEKETWYWTLETTKGVIKIRLLPHIAPNHVANTIYLTELGYYDSLKFHRVINDFMAQAGCPLGNGRGNPGYSFDGEISPAAHHDTYGILSAANAGPGTDGSQFFITFKPTPHLDGKHTVYGKVDKSCMPVVAALDRLGTPGGTPTEEIKIIKAAITHEQE